MWKTEGRGRGEKEGWHFGAPTKSWPRAIHALSESVSPAANQTAAREEPVSAMEAVLHRALPPTGEPADSARRDWLHIVTITNLGGRKIITGGGCRGWMETLTRVFRKTDWLPEIVVHEALHNYTEQAQTLLWLYGTKDWLQYTPPLSLNETAAADATISIATIVYFYSMSSLYRTVSSINLHYISRNTCF